MNRCPTCRKNTLAGPDDWIASDHIHIDPTPLTNLGEALARIQGTKTYELTHTHNRGHTIRRRNANRITWAPANSDKHQRITGGTDIVQQHQCTPPLWPANATTTSRKPKPATTPQLGDKPPY